MLALYRRIMRKQGFTLSELMIAFAILAFVVAGALGLFVTCILLNESSRNLSMAIGHAQFVLEDIKSTNFNSIKTGSIDQNTTWDWNASTITSRGLNALANESIDTQGIWLDASAKDRLNITVTVSWKDAGIRDRSTALETLLTEP